MKFSVCIPTYKRCSMLREAIKSVLNQTYSNFELIIFDNASHDGTRELVGEYIDHRIRYFENAQTISMYANHNLCIDHVLGDWVVYLHSDDTLDPNALEALESIITKSRADVIIPMKEIHKTTGDHFAIELRGHEGLTYMLQKPSATPTGTAYKTTHLKDYRFDEESHASDLKQLCQLLLHGYHIKLINENIVNIGVGTFQYSFEWGKTGEQTSDVAKVYAQLLENPDVYRTVQELLPNWNTNEISRLLFFLANMNKKLYFHELVGFYRCRPNKILSNQHVFIMTYAVFGYGTVKLLQKLKSLLDR